MGKRTSASPYSIAEVDKRAAIIAFMADHG
jgi:hypothetical protein